MRIAIALLLTGSIAYAGEIEGKIAMNLPKGQDHEIKIGCVTPKHGKYVTPIDSMIGLTVRAGNENDPVDTENRTFDPQVSRLVHDPKEGWSYRHSGISSGHCLIYVKVDNYLVWKRVKFSNPDEKVTLDLTVNEDDASELTVVVEGHPEGYRIVLIPTDDEGRIPFVNTEDDVKSVAMTCNYVVSGHLTQGKVLLHGVRPGHYVAMHFGAGVDVNVKEPTNVALFEKKK